MAALSLFTRPAQILPADALANAFPGCICGLDQDVPCFYACLPLTEPQAGNKQFVYDLTGRVYIASGEPLRINVTA